MLIKMEPFYLYVVQIGGGSGFCDQMKYYLYGKAMEDLGYKVKYDIRYISLQKFM